MFEKYEDYNDNEYGFSDDILDVLTRFFNNLPKQYAAIMNPRKYKNALGSIALITRCVESSLSPYGERAEYDIHNSSASDAIMARNIVFKIRIPEDVGFFIKAGDFREVFDSLDDNDLFNVSTYTNGDLDMVFEFKDVYNVVMI